MEILLSIFTFSVLVGTLLSVFMLIGSSVYDLVAASEAKRPTAISKTRRNRYRPTVSIIIPAYNEEQTIVRCLDGLKKLRYPKKKLEIIVSDDCSKDATKRITRAYIKAHPERAIRLVAGKTNGGRGEAINRGVAKSSGEIVVAFDADCIFAPNAIRKLVAHFANPRISAVAANVRILDDGTVLGMIQRLEYLVSFRSKKFNTITNSEFIIGGAGASYRASRLREAGGFDSRMKTEDIELSMRMTRLFGKNGGLVYASDYLVYTDPVPTYRALFKQRFRWKFGSLQALFHNRGLLLSISKEQNILTSWVRLPHSLWSEFMLLLEPVLFTTFVYIAIAGKNPWLFIGAAAAYTVVTWLAIWSDEHLAVGTKLHLSLLAPFMYFASFVMSLVQIVAAVRSLINIRSIVGLKAISGAYTTTERAKTQTGATV